jgi:hypothetical protein
VKLILVKNVSIFESCLDKKKPFLHKGNVASYHLELDCDNLYVRKIDADCLKKERKIEHKIVDAFFFLYEKDKNNKEIREKVLVVETKGRAYRDALKQLLITYKQIVSELKIEAHARIVAKGVPKIRPANEYRQLESSYKTIRDRSDKMTETYTSFEIFSIK